MPNTTGADWDEDAPALTDSRRDGATEIKVLRVGIADRLAKEHVHPDEDSVGGEHLEGSAIVYFEAEEPENKPDGETALDEDDEGRLWIDSDDDKLYFWEWDAGGGTGSWVEVQHTPKVLVDQTETAPETYELPEGPPEEAGAAVQNDTDYPQMLNVMFSTSSALENARVFELEIADTDFADNDYVAAIGQIGSGNEHMTLTAIIPAGKWWRINWVSGGATADTITCTYVRWGTS
jgi:hypothetical protein